MSAVGGVKPDLTFDYAMEQAADALRCDSPDLALSAAWLSIAARLDARDG